MVPSFPILDLLQDCCDPPLTREALEDLQARLGRRFPEEYAEFLLQFNGGHFMRSVEYSIPESTEFDSGGIIKSFIGEPNDECETDGLVWNAEMLSHRIPPNVLAIADCNFSDHVVLKLVGPESRFEGVWHWDCSESKMKQRLYWLADSFYEFLSMLVFDICVYEEDRETLPLFQAVERGAVTAIEQYLVKVGTSTPATSKGTPC